MSTKQVSPARTKALANCSNGYHQWHPTFTLGEKLCTVCGTLAFCPFCVSRLPHPHMKLMTCALHRKEREEVDV